MPLVGSSSTSSGGSPSSASASPTRWRKPFDSVADPPLGLARRSPAAAHRAVDRAVAVAQPLSRARSRRCSRTVSSAGAGACSGR